MYVFVFLIRTSEIDSSLPSHLYIQYCTDEIRPFINSNHFQRSNLKIFTHLVDEIDCPESIPESIYNLLSLK